MGMAASRVIVAAALAWWPTCSIASSRRSRPTRSGWPIAYIRSNEGWLFPAAVIGLYSRQIVDWATSVTMTIDLVLQALVPSDQGCQFTSSAHPMRGAWIRNTRTRSRTFPTPRGCYVRDLAWDSHPCTSIRSAATWIGRGRSPGRKARC